VIPQAAGLEVICAPTFELNITISNTVFKNNSGLYGGNIYIAVSELSLRHPQIMVHNGGHYITMLPADWLISTSHETCPSVSMVKDAMESVYTGTMNSPVT